MKEDNKQFEWNEKVVDEFIEDIQNHISGSFRHYDFNKWKENFKQSKSISLQEGERKKIKVENICAQDIYGLVTNGTAKYSNYIHFKFNSSISSLQIPLIRKAVEDILNDENCLNSKEGVTWDKETIVPLLTALVSQTWRASTFSEAQKLYDDFLLERGLMPPKPSTPTPTTSKEWEITAFSSHWLGNDNVILKRHENGSFTPGPIHVYENFLLRQSDAKINSVKRLSDGETFSIGDKVEFGETKAKPDSLIQLRDSDIMSWNIREDNMIYAEIRKDIFFPITHLHKAKPTQPSSTEDKGEIIWFVNSYWELHSKIKNTHHPADSDKNITVKDKEAGEQYILENKPCLSLNDLLEVWADGGKIKNDILLYKEAPLYKNFEQKAKQKLNQ